MLGVIRSLVRTNRQTAARSRYRLIPMPEPQRTLFATLLARHRDRLKLTQADVAARTDALHASGSAPRAVSERTIAALEGLTPPSTRVPHQATVRSIALALELTPNTPDHTAFLDAARHPTATPSATISNTTDEPDAVFLPQGRESHLARLEAAIDDAADEVPSVVLVTGDAGSGKSRLLQEVGTRALDRHENAVVLWGNCPRGFGAMSDHEPWRQILAQLLRDPIAGDSGPLPAVSAQRLDARLPQTAAALAGPAAHLVGRLTATSALHQPHVLESLDPDLRRLAEVTAASSSNQQVTRNDIDAAVMLLLERLAAGGPVVIVLDNLHWADEASRSTIHHIASTLATRRLPIVLLGSIRTGDPSTERDTQRLLDGVTACFPDAVLDLASTLGGESGRSFVDAAVARLGLHPLADRLFERTGGMPLYVMSFLRLHALDASAIDGNNVPAELDAVFSRQLAHLDDRSRALLAAASVQGDDFLAEPALAVAGIPIEEAAHYLDDLLAGQVRLVRPQLMAPNVTMHRYRFAHALLHEHVTGTLSQLERSHLHIRTADALQRALGARDHDAIELIATQLELGGDLRRAAATWRTAGDRALLRSDHHHARSIFQHIREMGLARAVPDVHVQAQVGIGNAWRALGRPDEARQALQQARREANWSQLHTVDANALMSLGVLDLDAGRMSAGAARFAAAVHAYTRAGELVEASRANANLSLALHGMGRYDEARAHAEEGISLGERAGNASAAASAEIARSNCWLDLGYYEYAIECYEASLARNDEHELTHYGNICLLNIALCNIELGRWDAAEATLDRLEDPNRRLVERLRSVVAFNGALIMEGRGDTDAAQRRYEASRQVRQQLGQAPLLIDSLAGLLRTAIATNDRATMTALLSDLESRVRDRGTVGVEHLGRLYLTMYEGHHANGDAARAKTWLSNATSLLGERANQLADPNHRNTYLSRPPAHRRIIALALAQGLSVPSLDRASA